MIQCPHCPKEIEGHTENQVQYLLNVHKLTKHKEEQKQD